MQPIEADERALLAAQVKLVEGGQNAISWSGSGSPERRQRHEWGRAGQCSARAFPHQQRTVSPQSLHELIHRTLGHIGLFEEERGVLGHPRFGCRQQLRMLLQGGRPAAFQLAAQQVGRA